MPSPVDPSRDLDAAPASDDPTLSPGWYQVRRTVKFRNFLLTGAVLGFLVGALISAIGPDSASVSKRSAVAFLGVVFALVGTLIAGVVAVLLDGRLHRGGGQG